MKKIILEDLNDYSKAFASYCLFNRWEIKYVSRIFVECSKRNDGRCYKTQILRVLELPSSPLLTEIFYSIHVLNYSEKPKDDIITYNEYFQFVTCFCLLPFRIMSRFILAMTEVRNLHFIDFNVALKLINLIHDPSYSKSDLISLYNFYKISTELPLDYENLMRIIKSQKYYTALHSIYRAIQQHIYTTSLYDSIKFKIKNYAMIATYQLDHDGQLPKLSCTNKIESILCSKPHPLSYDYHGVTDEEIIDIAKKMKGKRLFLSTERRSTPMITKLIYTGETQGIRANMAKKTPQYTPIYNTCSGFKLSVPLHTSRAAASSVVDNRNYCNHKYHHSSLNINSTITNNCNNNNNNGSRLGSTIALDPSSYNGDVNSTVYSSNYTTINNYSNFDSSVLAPFSPSSHNNNYNNKLNVASPTNQQLSSFPPPLHPPPKTLPPLLNVQISNGKTNNNNNNDNSEEQQQQQYNNNVIIKQNQILPLEYDATPIPEVSPS